MEMWCLQELILVSFLLLVEAKDLKIAFWIDPVQKDIYNDIASALKEIETLQLETEIEDFVIVVKKDFEYQAMDQFCEALATQGVSVVIDFTYSTWRDGLDMVQSYQLPYLRVDRMMNPYLQMFAEFLKQKGGNDVVMIMQNARDLDETLYQMFDGYPFRVLALNAAEEDNLVERLRSLRPSPSYYAIFAGGTNMNSIFDKINRGKLFERPQEWHFVFMDPRDRVFKYKKIVDYATKFTVNAKTLCRTLQMKDAYCLSGFTFQRALILEIFRSLIDIRQSNLNWLEPFQMQCNDTSTLDTPMRIQFDLLEHFRLTNFMTFATPSAADNEAELIPKLTYSLTSQINFYSSEHEAVTDLAVWQNGELRKINHTISPAKRHFRIGVTEAIPWNYLRRDPHTGEVLLDVFGRPIWEGFCIDFIQTLSEKLNFHYDLIEPKKGKFGKRDLETERFDGIIGDLASGETDFAVTALKMYAEREEVIDYIAPYFEQTGISIVMRKPVRQTSLFKFMTVLRLEVWLSIVAALVATAVLLWLLDKYSPYSWQNNKEAYPYPCREFSLRESFWFALTSFTPQGGGEAPKAVSGRTLVAAYWLFVVLMLATFTANLAAFLTVERMQTPVQSLDQLARQSRINYTVVADSDTHKYFINMKFAEDTLYRMWKELTLNASKDHYKYRIWDYPIREQYGTILLAINGSEPVRDAKEGFRKVNEHENADFAFIHDSSEIKYELTRNCNLTEVGEIFAEQPYAIAVQQGSHLADEFSFALLELQKDRYFEELKAKYWNATKLKECSASDEQEGITLESLGGVFIATFFGLGLAMVTLVLEILYYKRKFKQSFEDVIKVRPVSGVVPKQAMGAWQSARPISAISNMHKTPPPAFDAITFRGKQVPAAITLGGNEFKPRRLGPRKLSGSVRPTEQMDEGLPNRDIDLPPYTE